MLIPSSHTSTEGDKPSAINSEGVEDVLDSIQPNRAPVIESLTTDPTGQVSKNDTIRFQVKASDPDDDELRLTWGATKGLLSATKGDQVQWRPVRFDGSFESGTSIVLVSVDDNRGGIETGHINLSIDSSGNTTVQKQQISTGPQLVRIHVNYDRLQLAQGESAQLQAHAQFEDGTKDERLFWFSSDPEAISVTDSGQVQRIGKGNGFIIILSDRNPTIQKQIYVSEPAASMDKTPQAGVYTSPSAPSGSPSQTVNNPTPQPSGNSLLAPPNGLKMLNMTRSSVTLSWESQLNAQSYHLYQNGTLKASNLTQTNHTVQGLVPGENYQFALSSVNQGGESLLSNPITVQIPTTDSEETASEAPNTPTGLNATHTNTNQITVQWQKVSGASSYEVYLDGNLYAKDVISPSYTLTNLQANTSYAIKIRSINKVGASPDSGILSVNTTQEPPIAPIGLQASQITAQSFRLNWQGVTGASDYQISLNGNVYQNNHVGTQLDLSGLQPETVYQVQIQARNSSGTSPLSTTLTVNTTAAEVPLAGSLIAGTSTGIYKIAANGSGEILLANGKLTDANSQHIAYVQNGDIFIKPLSSGSPVNISNTPGSEPKDNHAVFSPNGSQIAWVATGRNEENQYFQSILSISDLTGSGLQRLNYSVGFDSNLQWSSDGSKILYESYRSGINTYVAPLDGSGEVQLTHAETFQGNPRLSPNNQKIAYVQLQGGMANIHLMNADGSNTAQISHHPTFTKSHLRWEPNGQSLVFQTGTSTPTGNHVYRLTPGGSMVQLTHSNGENSHPVWSPDGKKIAFCSTRNGSIELFIMNPDGSAQTRLSGYCSSIESPLIWVN